MEGLSYLNLTGWRWSIDAENQNYHNLEKTGFDFGHRMPRVRTLVAFNEK